jgi:hypothetical protein
MKYNTEYILCTPPVKIPSGLGKLKILFFTGLATLVETWG